MNGPRLDCPTADRRAGGDRKAVPELTHLNQEQLARRWNVSGRTLERWRWRKEGPSYLKVGGRVRYRLDDIESYESRRLYTARATHQLQAAGATDESR
jgi:hypothetical protein